MSTLMGVGILTTLVAQEPKHPKSHPTTLIEAVVKPLVEFLSRPSAIYLLLVIVFYKFGDAFIAKMFTAFFLRGLSFSLTEVGSVLKMVGLATTIIGAITAGILMARLSLYRALIIFGFCQAFSNLMFVWLSYMGHHFPAMVATVIIENFCSGLGNAAFVALLISLCDVRYTAFQYALFTAISAVPREFLGPVAGHLVDHVGWSTFFMITFLTSLPGLYCVWKAKAHLD
jgi:PAT family beta-lactamase induction signal transducer AmpG